MADTLFPLPPPQLPKEAPASAPPAARPRLRQPRRDQVELQVVDPDTLVSDDHVVREVWAYTGMLNFAGLLKDVKAVDGQPGHPATDPRLLTALWLYAMVEGVGSARALSELTRTHPAYRWLCGGVSVNHHTLADFRVVHGAQLDAWLTEGVAALVAEGAVTLKQVCKDGVRVRASAGAASFRREETLQHCLEEAQRQVQALKAEVDQDPAGTTRRQQAARERAVREREERVRRALATAQELQALQNKPVPPQDDDPPSPPPAGAAAAPATDEAKPGKSPKKPRPPRASTTDSEARVMKMADGGFRPAFNAQLAVATGTRPVIVDVDVTNQGTDQGQLVPLQTRVMERYGVAPQQALVDGGYVSLAGIATLAAGGTEVLAPVPKPRDATRNPYQALPRDPPAVAAWRQRMGTTTAQETYKARAANSEWVNAQLRNHGLQRLPVRGLEKVRAVLLWMALAHNLVQVLAMRRKPR